MMVSVNERERSLILLVEREDPHSMLVGATRFRVLLCFAPLVLVLEQLLLPLLVF